MRAKVYSILSKLLPEKILFYAVQLYYALLNVLLEFLKLSRLPTFVVRLVQSIGVEAVTFKQLESHAIENQGQVDYLITETYRLCYSPVCFDYKKSPGVMVKSDQDAKQYVVVLKQVAVIGGSNIILTGNNNALYNFKYQHTSVNYRFTDGAILAYHNDNCLIHHKQSNRQFDEAICLSGNFSFNYYHLMYEILVKFQQLERLELDTRIPILVDQVTMDVPQYHELFQLLNKEARKIIPIEKGKSYQVERLYAISCPNLMPPDYWSIEDVKASDTLFNLDTLTYLRDNLLPFSSSITSPARIFLSRRKASGRRSFNEVDVFQVLSKYGFEIIYPEDYTIAEQISLFNQADFIAGGSGAAFTNILFCKARCTIICFANYALDISIFSTIATHVGAEMVYLVDDSKSYSSINTIHDSFSVDLMKLDDFVRNMISC